MPLPYLFRYPPPSLSTITSPINKSLCNPATLVAYFDSQTPRATSIMMFSTTFALFLSGTSTVAAAGSAWIATQDYGNATFVTDVDAASQQWKVQWTNSYDLANVSILIVPGGGFGNPYAYDDEYTTTVTQGTTSTYTKTVTATATETVKCPEHNSNGAPHWALDVFDDKYCPGDAYSTITLLQYGTFCLGTPNGTKGARIRQCMMGGCSTTLFQDEHCTVGPTHIENELDCLRLGTDLEIKSLVIAC